MGTIVLAQVRDPKTRKARRVRVQLLGANVEELEQDGMIYYTIPAELIEILKNSEVYARLKTQVMYCFESKYSLLLYEMVERRIGLSYTQSEEFTVKELRELLNVPKGKLERYADFNKYCLKVAQNEVNKLCGFAVEFTPVKIGRKVERVRMMWLPKTGDGKRQAQSLLDSHSVVRRARMKSGFPDLPLLVDTAPFEER
jgi:plasmid replication initiation protein